MYGVLVVLTMNLRLALSVTDKSLVHSVTLKLRDFDLLWICCGLVDSLLTLSVTFSTFWCYRLIVGVRSVLLYNKSR